MSAEQVTLREVVALLYRADWTRLSLSATLASWTDHELRRRMRGIHHPPVSPDGGEREPPVTEHSKHVLLAPGGKYRISQDTEDGPVHQVCDGETAWYIQASPPWASGGRRAEGGHSAAHRPAWRICSSRPGCSAAKAAAGLGVAGAAALVGWLQKRPRSR
jgi:hypothetical protein